MTYEEKIVKFKELLQKSNRVVFFGGAGVSTESNIPDFRSQDGLYNQKYDLPPEQIISASYFNADTVGFYRFYRDKMLFPNAEPNACHKALARLEREGKLTAVVTQNIDGLHQKAGSKKVLELHGSIHRNYCQRCHEFYTLSDLLKQKGVPHCNCTLKGIIKPDVVLYGEALDGNVMSQTIEEIEQADVLIVGGTSLNVYPAASFIRFFRGKYLILMNKSKTSFDSMADVIIREPIGEVFAELMKHL